MKPLLFIRAVAFYLGYSVFITLFSLLSCTVGLLLPISQRQTLATTGNWLINKWLQVTCGIRVKIVGEENIPEGPFVVLSNHQSPWETFFLQRKLRPVSTILKKELLKIPFFGWGLASVRPIAIDRANPRQAIKEVMAQGKQRIEAGMRVIVYPEGTRIAYGEYGNYARSGASLAVEAGVPVLPVAHNAGRHWPTKKFLKNPGIITIIFGKPMFPENYNSKELISEAERWIKTQQQSINNVVSNL